MDAAARWEQIEAEWLARDGIGPKRMLQSTGLAGANGKVFASLMRDRLMLKLPAARVDALVIDHAGERLTARGKSPMREWVTIGSEHGAEWPALVAEAHAFGAGGGG